MTFLSSRLVLARRCTHRGLPELWRRIPGIARARIRAKRFLVGHLKHEGLTWRYLSRAALTIWISRNGSEQQWVAELIRLKHTLGTR